MFIRRASLFGQIREFIRHGRAHTSKIMFGIGNFASLFGNLGSQLDFDSRQSAEYSSVEPRTHPGQLTPRLRFPALTREATQEFHLETSPGAVPHPAASILNALKGP